MSPSALAPRIHTYGRKATITEVWPRRDVVELRISGQLGRRDAYPITDLLTACILEGARHVHVHSAEPVDGTIRAVLDRALPRRS